jgi:hypothetical protein
MGEQANVRGESEATERPYSADCTPEAAPAGRAPRAREILAIAAAAVVLTGIMAAPVLRAPAERLFGLELVGRHHDPFTVMAQFSRPVTFGVYTQPFTDVPGAFVALVTGPVAAYNWLVLVTFPLAAVATYLLARHVGLAPGGATVAALACAFSPFHVAQAAYHPHIAQVQWLPLYLFALWRCLDQATRWTVVVLVTATAGVVLSNFYGGLIAAVLTPVAIGVHRLVRPARGAQRFRNLAVTVGSLGALCAAGFGYAWYAASAVVSNRAAFAFPRVDLFLYSAAWWSYVVPPAASPLDGGLSQRIWAASGVTTGLLEQQVSLGWGVVAAGAVAVTAFVADRRHRRSLAWVPGLVILGAAAFACSLSPELVIGPITLPRPSGLLYGVLPMFRAYARFGSVVQLMAAVLAGLGIDWLWSRRTAGARVASVALVLLAAAEYGVWPPNLWRDVLPRAHRWLVQQGDGLRALDCEWPTPALASVPWLTGDRVSWLGGAFYDCGEPNIADKLAAAGFTHLLVRRDRWESRWLASRAVDGLRAQATIDTLTVFSVAGPPPPVYTSEMVGFWPREHDDRWTWRWAGAEASWRVVNRRDRTVRAHVDIQLRAVAGARNLTLRMDGQPALRLVAGESVRLYRVGPFTLTPGEHALVFRGAEPPTVADLRLHNGDPRALSFAVGTWRWTTEGQQP